MLIEAGDDEVKQAQIFRDKNDWPAIVLDQRRYALLKGMALAVPQAIE